MASEMCYSEKMSFPLEFTLGTDSLNTKVIPVGDQLISSCLLSETNILNRNYFYCCDFLCSRFIIGVGRFRILGGGGGGGPGLEYWGGGGGAGKFKQRIERNSFASSFKLN